MLPYGAREVFEARRKGYRPLGGVILTDDRKASRFLSRLGFAVCILPWEKEWDGLDLRFCHALDVLYGHREQGRKAVDFAKRLYEAGPRSLTIKNIVTKRITLL